MFYKDMDRNVTMILQKSELRTTLANMYCTDILMYTSKLFYDFRDELQNQAEIMNFPDRITGNH